jgi:hypothetical protein
VPYLLFNQRRYLDAHLSCILDRYIRGIIVQGQEFSLNTFTGVYNRMLDDQALPDVGICLLTIQTVYAAAV